MGITLAARLLFFPQVVIAARPDEPLWAEMWFIPLPGTDTPYSGLLQFVGYPKPPFPYGFPVEPDWRA